MTNAVFIHTNQKSIFLNKEFPILAVILRTRENKTHQ